MADDDWKPTPRQAEFLSCPCYEVLYGGAKGGGKLLQCSTPLPTPTGWTTMGEVRVGDLVLGEDGKPTRVVFVSDIDDTEDAYRLTFSDGTSIVAGENHPWKTMTAKEREQAMRRDPEWIARRRESRASRSKGKRPDLAVRNASKTHKYLEAPTGVVRKTKEIVDSLYVKRGIEMANHSIANAAPLELPSQALPVPPYTLGAWLGDGSKTSGMITGIDTEIMSEIEKDGFKVVNYAVPKDHCVHGLVTAVRSAGLYGNKHIPQVYLRASYEQRLALLHGLMDTDGWCEKDGSCKIALTRKVLFDGVVELLRTFGITVNVSKGFKSAKNGREGNRSECWTACFVTSLPAFRLPRKLTRQNRTPNVRYSRRFVVAAENLGKMPMKCIQVDNEDHMYLAGDQFIPTHNTEAMLRMHLPQLQAAEDRFHRTGKKSLGWAVFFRKTFPQLEEVIARSQLIFPAFGATYKSDQHCWIFPSGYRFQFAHLENDDSHVAWNGKQITLLMIDQVEEIPEHQYLFLRMQIRTSDPDLRPLLGARLSANPLGRHVDWVKKRFVAEYKEGGHVFVDEFKLAGGKKVRRDRVFIKATLRDNPHLTEEYEAELQSLPEDMRRAFLNGDWDVSLGSFFADVFSPDVHVIEPIEISPHWEVFRSADWGSRAPASCHWWAVDEEGDCIIFDELYGPGSTGREWAKKIKAREAEYGERFIERDPETQKVVRSRLSGPLDWAANSQNGFEGPTPAEQMMEEGVMWYPADKRRKEGWAELRSRLKHRTNPRKPGLRIFSHCEALIAQLKKVIPAENDPDDIAHGTKKQEDHALDDVRYGAMSRPVTAKDSDTAKMDQWQRIMYENAERKVLEQLEDMRNDVTGY